MSVKPTMNMKKKMLIMTLVLVIGGFGSALVSLINIMFVHGEEYSKMAADQQSMNTTLAAERGNIYDTNMNILATSATVWTVYITPKDIDAEDDPEKTRQLIVDGLSSILELSKESVYNKTIKNTSYEKIKTQVEEPEAEKVRKYVSDNKLGSIVGLDESSKRYYPNGTLASTVLGFVGDDNQGLGGLESYYDETLTGVPGKVVALKNARGSAMPYSYETTVDAQNGHSLVLTVDSTIQYYTEKYLEAAVKENNATNGMCIVMNVNNGEIYAMANEPDYDPNEPFVIYDEGALASLNELTEGTAEYNTALNKARQAQWRNNAISDTYEPGSVFKIVTGAAAIEENLVNTSSSFNCGGNITIKGTKYNCHKIYGHGSQSLAKIFANSCNPAFIEIGQKLGVSKFVSYFRSFGLTELTGIDLPGEAKSIYYTEKNMGAVELASESFGQTFKVTPVQMITAVCAAANGGQLVTPHLVKQVIDSEGNIIKSNDKNEVRQVVSKSTSELVCDLLETVVNGGTGKNAYVAGYNVAGKTGTSQKVDQKDETGEITEYVASFCGFAPYYDPEVAIIVILNEPHGESVYGGTIAAPVAGSILSEVLPYLGVEPRYTEAELAAMSVSAPNLVGKSVDVAKSTLSANNLKYKVYGNGTEVTRQVPAASTTVPAGGTVVLYTENSGEQKKITVPDFKGMTLSQANTKAASLGINLKISGSSLSESGTLAYSQSVAAGTEVEMGTIITVKFRYNDNVE